MDISIKRRYNRIFKLDPLAANFFLLMCELADDDGTIVLPDDGDLSLMLRERFTDPLAYQL